MLDTFRKASQSWYIKILFALLIGFFVLWGISGEVFRAATDKPAITVGKQAISPREVQQSFQRDAERLQQLSGGRITIDQARKMGLMQNTVQQMVNRALLDQGAAALDLGVDENTLRRIIADDPSFQNELKVFDKRVYQMTLQRAGLSEPAFLREEQGNILRELLVGAVSGGLTVPDQMVDPLFRYENEQRVAETITFPADKMPTPAKPADDVLKAYYDAHKDGYMAPESRAITALLVRTVDVAADIHPSEEDIAKSYEIRQGEFQTTEKRSIQQVVFPDQAKAQAFSEAVRQGKDFATEAKAANALVGDLGWTDKASMPLPELAAAAFSMPGNSISAPVQSPLGWHVIRVSGVAPGKTRPLSEVHSQIAQDLVKDEAVNRLFAQSTQIEDAIGSGASVEEAANTLHLQALKIAALDAQGNGPDGKPAAAVPLAPAFLATAFQTAQSATSEVKPLDDNAGYFALHVDNVTAPALKPFDTVKDQVLADWSGEQKGKAARQMAQAAADRIQKGEAPSAVAGAFKFATTAPFRRTVAQDSPLPPLLVAEMFKAAPNGVAVVDVQDGAMAARLTKVIAADPATQVAAFEGTRRKIAQDQSNDVMSEYLAALRKDFAVSINASLLDQQQTDQ